jgi:tRNA-specific 2-thiouridylase
MIYAVAMSGGVDSSVAAYLLKKEGHQVIGFTMNHFDDSNPIYKPQSISKAIDDAQQVCKILEIDHYTIDLKEPFFNIVINDMLNEYKNGFTPNPCTICNPRIKWGKFPDEIQKIILDKFHTSEFKMATGHYAKKIYIDDKPALIRPEDKSKDQTYMLWRLSSEQLNNTEFPLSGFTKDVIRKLAAEANIPVAEKKDSQDICFINDKYTDFIANFLENKTGKILFHDGKAIGNHLGLHNYTIGQRKGLIPWNKPLYVLKLDAQNNCLIVTDDVKKLEAKTFSIRNLNLIRETLPLNTENLCVKIRYNSQEVKVANLTQKDHDLIVELLEPEKSITPGQSAVFYRHDELVGGGIIDKVFHEDHI